MRENLIITSMIDIQQRMAQGKGPAYERWAKVYNLKQMAAALQYLQEHNLTDYDELAASTEAAVDRFHTLAGELRDTEAALSHTVRLMGVTSLLLSGEKVTQKHFHTASPLGLAV